MPSLEEKLYLCLRDEIVRLGVKDLSMQRAPFPGAAALCAGEDNVFCSDDAGAIWRLDGKTMLEQSMCSGGPGVRDLCLSVCGSRLFALLGEGDSVLMSDARTCRPLVLNRCGCNPGNLSCCDRVLAAAGGESSCVYLYSTLTLECLDEIPMPGRVCSVALKEGALFALCMTQDLSAMLVIRRKEKQSMLHLPGTPGCLLAAQGCLYAATQGALHVIDAAAGALLGSCNAPGRAARMCMADKKLFVLDELSESVFASDVFGCWKEIAGGVRYMWS